MISYSSVILVANIIDITKDYGVLVTLLLLTVLIAYMLIKNSSKRIKEQEQKIDSLYNKIDKLILNSKNNNAPNTALTGKFISYAENSNKIQIQLYHILQTYGAERVSIYEFHNGGKNLAGVEFKKCSNTYEAVSLETKPLIKGMQNLPLSINPLWNKILATRQDLIIPSTEELEDTFLSSYLESQNIKSYYSTILLDYDNTRPIGFISIESYKDVINLTHNQIEEFKDISIKISVLINIK